MRVNKTSRRKVIVASGGKGGNCPTLNCGFTKGSMMRDDYISARSR